MYPMFTQEILQGIQLFMIALCGTFLPIVGDAARKPDHKKSDCGN